MLKICIKCNIPKDENKFRLRTDTKKVDNICIECRNEACRLRYSKLTDSDKKQITERYYTNKPLNKRIWENLKSRAKKFNIEFTITVNDIIVPEYCPIFTNIKLKHDNNYVQDDSPSGDRINNNLGYIPGNVIVTSVRANRLKNDGTPEEHKRLYEYYSSL